MLGLERGPEPRHVLTLRVASGSGTDGGRSGGRGSGSGARGISRRLALYLLDDIVELLPQGGGSLLQLRDDLLDRGDLLRVPGLEEVLERRLDQAVGLLRGGPVDLDGDGALTGGDEQCLVQARDDAVQGVVVARGAGRERAEQGQPHVPRRSRGSTLGVQAGSLDEGDEVLALVDEV